MPDTAVKTVAREALGAMLIFAGVSHLTVARKPFRAQVPKTVSKLSALNEDQIVVLSGLAEIGLGATIMMVGPEHRKLVGRLAAAFFAAVFPGNIAQYENRRTAFGLDTDNKRFGRLFFQPVLVLWALMSS